MKVHPFKFEDRHKIAEAVVAEAKKLGVLSGIKVCCSHECGFYFYADSEWRNKLVSNNIWLGYHCNQRQLRFVYENNGYIVKLRFKDSVESWTQDEIEVLVEIINKVVSRLYLI